MPTTRPSQIETPERGLQDDSSSLKREAGKLVVRDESWSRVVGTGETLPLLDIGEPASCKGVSFPKTEDRVGVARTWGKVRCFV